MIPIEFYTCMLGDIPTSAEKLFKLELSNLWEFQTACKTSIKFQLQSLQKVMRNSGYLNLYRGVHEQTTINASDLLHNLIH